MRKFPARSWLGASLFMVLLCAGEVALAQSQPAPNADAPKGPTAPKAPVGPSVPVAKEPSAHSNAPKPPVVADKAVEKPAAASPVVPATAAATVPAASPSASKSAIDQPGSKEPAVPKHRPEHPSAAGTQATEHKAVDRKDNLPPSLTLEALHAEISNSPAEIERNNLLKERERIGELAGALDVAQKQLRQDTEKLAAYLEEVRKQTEEVKLKRVAEKEEAEKAEIQAKEAKAPIGPQPAMPLEVLAKAMKGMKAAQAAAITERLPLTLAGDVMERMPARDAGKVMGLMNPERAAALAAEIASREERRKRVTK
jgi:flagellar motility protein MotE (MotC chaperone)